jgi:hypothetical protein
VPGSEGGFISVVDFVEMQIRRQTAYSALGSEAGGQLTPVSSGLHELPTGG